MNELQEKVIAALSKQVELLTKDGLSEHESNIACKNIDSLTGLLKEIRPL